MNITSNLVQEERKVLPELVKKFSTYKIIVPAKVEQKIRYLCRKFPNLEWSGVLFTKHSGTFENNDLVITCEDIYPMDLGSSTFTQFKMDESVAGYMAENLELFGCSMSLVHSHNKMSAFFSGTDIATLRSEGNDTNCFVSLIVNNEGSYCAAVTRKMQTKSLITTKNLGQSYQFFGEGTVSTDTSSLEQTEAVDKEIIEYFMLDVERETVDEPLAYLDKRFEEIEQKKKRTIAMPTNGYNHTSSQRFLSTSPSPIKENKEEEHVWLPEIMDNSRYKEPTLWDDETMEEMKVAQEWAPDPTIIHHLVCQMITTSLIINKDVDLKQWIVKHMERQYGSIFADWSEFENYADAMVEFMVNHYSDDVTPDTVLDDFDEYLATIAQAMLDELDTYPSNTYIEEYQKKLNNYVFM